MYMYVQTCPSEAIAAKEFAGKVCIMMCMCALSAALLHLCMRVRSTLQQELKRFLASVLRRLIVETCSENESET